MGPEARQRSHRAESSRASRAAHGARRAIGAYAYADPYHNNPDALPGSENWSQRKTIIAGACALALLLGATFYLQHGSSDDDNSPSADHSVSGAIDSKFGALTRGAIGSGSSSNAGNGAAANQMPDAAGIADCHNQVQARAFAASDALQDLRIAAGPARSDGRACTIEGRESAIAGAPRIRPPERRARAPQTATRCGPATRPRVRTHLGVAVRAAERRRGARAGRQQRRIADAARACDRARGLANSTTAIAKKALTPATNITSTASAQKSAPAPSTASAAIATAPAQAPAQANVADATQAGKPAKPQRIAARLQRNAAAAEACAEADFGTRADKLTRAQARDQRPDRRNGGLVVLAAGHVVHYDRNAARDDG